MLTPEAALLRAVKLRAEANALYKRSIINANKAGMSNVKIAKIVGVSETAIRLYRKRNGL